MDSHAISVLRAAMKAGLVIWTDGERYGVVSSLSRRAEEDALAEDGDGGLCANFLDGTYVCLENCELSEFAEIERLTP